MRLTTLPFRLVFALGAAFVLAVTVASAHPGHSSPDITPWYRYLPPGASLPATPSSH
jgi:hypothetical protein